MTDQEIIKALRARSDNCVKCETDCAFNRLGCCMDALQMAAADRLEELTASQHVMTIREDA